MDSESLVAEFRSELPFYLSCSEVTAEKSAFQVRAYFRGNPEPFPQSFTRQKIIAWLSHKASTPPLNSRKARREPSTVNDILKSIRRFARWAVARELIDKDPTEGIRGLVERDRVIFAPDDAEMLALVMASRSYGDNDELKLRNHAICSLMTDTGPRAAELLGMDVQDVMKRRQVADRVIYRGKGGKERLAPLHEQVQCVIEKYLQLRRPAPGVNALWVDISGHRLTYPGLRHMLTHLCKATGTKISLHDFRRYAHTSLWLKGISLVDGMALSGHENTRDYTTYIRRAIQERALEEARKRSPLSALLSMNR